MARIAFILLCHKDPEGVIEQARRLTAVGDYMAIHFDGRAAPGDYRRIRAALKDNPNVVFAWKRAKCGWGEWSLVQATLYAVQSAVAAFPKATHFYMLSGDCMAIKTAEYVHDTLDREEVDYIESFDFFTSGWIKTGLREERLIYRHPFNERSARRLFYATLALQRRLGLTRAVPADLRIMIGSQWWCLRRATIEAILAFCRARPAVLRFFRGTWIPDETFFQTLVPHLVPDGEIRRRPLTFLMFSDYGMPVTFYNDHYGLLLNQDYLFARKISPEARQLKARLGDLYAARGMRFRVSDEGRPLYQFLTGRGRVGRRFAPRVWETESSLGRERELMIVICKKWHVAKRLVERIRGRTGLPVVEYLFDEADCPLPDLGGLQGRLEKRSRHRRALLRMLFDHHRSHRLVLCMDPSGIDLLHDFCSDRARTPLLEIECSFSEAYLAGHARRVGLATEATPPETLAQLLPAIRNDILHEGDRIRDAGFAGLGRLREAAGEAENAAALAEFLSVSHDEAQEILSLPHLFLD
ncbi:beta-1,6-N-acetylglucosaminyltransferase [Pseudooceanicola sp. CBS1P-1]|uniref:Peptide O-xylosyltransferase n=1 Tax=Pseudooceanicola albus TaxID=2692189 RepID=A0A6L7G1X2_9RHOB|nr:MULTISPECIES: DUF5928 domain-containing protein [Pseudooceanicola]MBT9384015.1 beta-1,6-N-acetylglucosaminyltransferase [Pseudooceanicola endophyticus]MXN16573.1 glycosyl transferase [Pseudooceanicola albus]